MAALYWRGLLTLENAMTDRLTELSPMTVKTLDRLGLITLAGIAVFGVHG